MQGSPGAGEEVSAEEQRQLTDARTRYWASVWPSEIFAINDFREGLHLSRLTAADLDPLVVSREKRGGAIVAAYRGAKAAG